MKKHIAPTSVVFLLFLFAFAVLMAALPKKEYSENEKRYYAALPEVTAEGLKGGNVQTSFENWYSDHFPLRDLWVGISAYLKLLEGRNTQQDVYYAKDGYLINDPETHNVELFEKNLDRFETFAEKTGLPAGMILVPSSGHLNEKVLPAGHGSYHDDELFALAEDALHRVAFYDLRDDLRKANEDRNVFYRTDHHLTAYGCYTLYAGWREKQGLPYLPESGYTVTAYDGFYGTCWSSSGYWLVPPDRIELWDGGGEFEVTITDSSTEQKTADSLFFPDHLEKLDKYPVYLDGNHALTKIENKNAAEGALLIIKDSFAHCFSTFLANDYQTVYLMDLRYYRGSISGFVEENGVDELLYLYSVDSLLTDTNSGWLY